jgi:hypothetical protein
MLTIYQTTQHHIPEDSDPKFTRFFLILWKYSLPYYTVVQIQETNSGKMSHTDALMYVPPFFFFPLLLLFAFLLRDGGT